MRVVVHWSGGKDCCTAYHKIIEHRHEVACLVTYVYMDPYIFHSFKVIEQQAKALGVPHVFVKITGNRYDDIMGTLERLHKEQKVEAIVTGDIDNVHHRRVWRDACKKLDMKLIMPLWDRPLNLIPGSRYRKRIMNMELSTGVKAILSCVDQRYFTEDWLGRKIDEKCVEDMKPLVGPAGKGIDVSGEPGEYHSTTLDAPLFKQAIEITKFTKKSKVVDFGGSPYREGNFLYMDIEEAVLKPKNQV
jgi:diphthine-ammonia ligase